MPGKGRRGQKNSKKVNLLRTTQKSHQTIGTTKLDHPNKLPSTNPSWGC